MKKVHERFLEYVKVDTKSDETTRVTPSTKGQLELGKILAEELKEIGVDEVRISDKGYVYACLKSNCNNDIPKIGFISHMDTAPDMSGKNVNPKIVENYDGKDIELGNGYTLSPSFSPELPMYKGQTLITTDGTTLLGADDKAGVAAIISAVAYLKAHPEIKHGKIRIAFTPDEEIGEGADHFDVKKFGCEWGYTIDGGQIGELEYENFNAAAVRVSFKGLNVHPGYAKDKMRNAALLAAEFAMRLPATERPEHTSGYEGFFHLTGMTGSVEEATLTYIVRDHDRGKFEARKALFAILTDDMNNRYPDSVTLEIKDQYYNMKSVVEPKKEVVDLAFEAMTQVGVKPLVKPIRGGTDGARLSFMGLPCPNLFAGGLNFHGRYEFLPIPSLEKSMETIIKIIELTAHKS